MDIDNHVHASRIAIHDRMLGLVVECPHLADLEMLRHTFGNQVCAIVGNDRDMNPDRPVPRLMVVPVDPRDAVWLGSEDEGVDRAAEGASGMSKDEIEGRSLRIGWLATSSVTKSSALPLVPPRRRSTSIEQCTSQ